jgi:Ca2+-binding EF-hand superfamily protein
VKRSFLILLALLPAGQLNAQARFEGRFKGRNRRPAQGNMKEMLEKYDENNDGILDMKERMKARKEQMKNFKPQKNKDKPQFNKTVKPPMKQKFSQLAEKLESLKEKNPQKYGAILKKFDRNGNQQLDEAEIGQLFREKNMQQNLIQNFDKNGNGKIDEDEMALIESEHQKHISVFAQRQPDLFASILDQFDKNQNQKLDFGEWVVAQREGVFPSKPPQKSGHLPRGPQMGRQGRGRPDQPFAGNFSGNPPQPPHSGFSNMSQPQPSHPPMPPGQPPQSQPQPQPESETDGGLLDGVELKSDNQNDQNNIEYLDF